MNLSSHLKICLLVIGLNLIGVSAFAVKAQTAGPNSAQIKKKRPPSLSPIQQRALETLDSLSMQARQIDNPAVRAELQSLIADALWDFDRPTARNIFIDAFKNARRLEDPDEMTAAQTEILRHVWRRDRALAEDLMKQLSTAAKEKGDGVGRDFGLSSQFGMQNSDPAVQQRLELAKSLIEGDPAAAAELISYSLQREVSFAGINQLKRLKATHPETADSIFGRAVTELQSLQPTAAVTAAIAMADYLSPTCSVCSQKSPNPAILAAYFPAALRVLRRSIGEVPRPAPLKPDLQQRVVQYFHEMQALLALTLSRFADPVELGELQGIYAERIQTLTPLKQRTMQAVEQQQKSSDRFADLFHNAETIAEPDQRDIALANVAQLVLRQDLDEKLLERLEEKIELIQSKPLHDKLWSLLKFRQVEKHIKAEELDRAYTSSLKLPDPVIRAKALRLLAAAVAKKSSERLTTSGLLIEAFESLKKSEPSIERSQIMFRITSDFIELKDYDQSFATLENSSASLEGLKESDFRETARGAVPNSLFDYRGTFGRLGRIDFDTTLFVAESIKWREFRLAAQIVACRSVLSRGK